MKRCATVLSILLSLSLSAQTPRFVDFNSADGLPSNTVYAITQDHDGLLWVGTRGGLSRFDGISFTSWRELGRVNALTVDRDNRIWAGTEDGLKVKDGQHFADGPEGNIRALYTDSDGAVWATVGDTLLLKLSYRDGIREEARCWYSKRDSEGDYPYYQIFEDSVGRLWLGGRIVRTQCVEDREHPAVRLIFGNGGFCTGNYAEAGEKLYSFDDHTSILYTIDGDEATPCGRLPISHARLMTDRSGRLWAAGSYGFGLVNQEKPERTIVYKTSSQELYCIYQDRQGNIWVGGDSGLSAMSSALRTVRQISDANVTALLQDSRGKMWIGTADDRVSCLYEDSEGTVYVGLWNNTGFEVWKDGRMHKERLTGKTPELQRPAAESLDGANWISAFLEDSRGRFWVVSWEGVGLNEWDRKSGHALPPRWLSPFRYPSPQVDSNIYVSSRLGSALIEDAEGNLVYGTTQAGLNIIDRTTGLVTKYFRGNSDIPDDYVTDLCLTPDGTVWAATRAGLWRCPVDAGHDGEEEAGQNVMADSDRPSLLLQGILVQSIEADARGRLWAGTEEGLMFVDTDGSVGVARKELGFPSNIYGEHVSCVLPDGSLAFGGPEGAAVFHPDSLLSLKANGNLILQPLISHRHRLNGGQWLDGPFTGLPDNVRPGRYTLEEQSSDVFGRWEKGESSVRAIRVPQPLWLRWPFLLIYVLLLAAIIITLVRLRERRLLKNELDMRNRLFSIISHDLRNPVAGNNTLAHQLLARLDSLSPEQLKNGLQALADSTDETSSLLENLLLWSLSQKGMLGAVMRDEELASLASDAAASVRGGEIIELQIPDGTIVRTDRNMLLTCLRNLLDNAVKATPAGGKVVLRADGKHIHILDNGPGFRDGASAWGHGLGLVITRELLDKMDATMDMRNRPEGGLEIIITL